MNALLPLLTSALLGGAEAVPPFAEDAELWEKARRLHARALVLDGHSDVTFRFADPSFQFGERHADGHMDIPRMREGGLDAQFFSIYMPDMGQAGTGRASLAALRIIDRVHEQIRRWPAHLALAETAGDVRRIHREGRIACLMGMEGGHIIENELANLRMFYRLGVRYLTLTHSFHTDWADSAGTGQPIEPRHGGLTDQGRAIVEEVNRVGMLVDISHVADTTFRDALEVSRAPVIASHSSCRALCSSPRNMDDDMLRALAGNGGVVQINFYTGYLNDAIARDDARLMRDWGEEEQRRREEERRRVQSGEEPDDDLDRTLRRARRAWITERRQDHPTPFSLIVDHVEHAIAVAGPAHVGLGADWDGIPALPDGMPDCSLLPHLTYELLARGHAEEVVLGVLGENVLRVLEQAEQVARAMREEDWQAEQVERLSRKP